MTLMKIRPGDTKIKIDFTEVPQVSINIYLEKFN